MLGNEATKVMLIAGSDGNRQKDVIIMSPLDGNESANKCQDIPHYPEYIQVNSNEI